MKTKDIVFAKRFLIEFCLKIDKILCPEFSLKSLLSSQTRERARARCRVWDRASGHNLNHNYTSKAFGFELGILHEKKEKDEER